MAAAIVAGGTFASVPFFGILGAGMALLTAEIASSIGYIRYAKRWLTENELQWPHQSFRIALASVIISTAAMAGMILLPQLKWVIFAVSMVMLGANFWRYWQVLPLLATQRARHLIGNLPFVKRFFFV
jgi:hypothetical protein